MEKNDFNIFKEVREKSSIVDVISYFLGAKEIKKKGNRYACRCPFHDDHSPSMMIDPIKNTFKCFVDGEGGDSIYFVQRYTNVSSLEALKKVAEICNIQLPNNFSTVKKNIPEVEKNFPNELKALESCKELYCLNLLANEGKEAREYLENRKLSQEVINHFGIGLAFKDPSDLVKKLRENKGFEVETLEKAGILSNSSSLIDRYSDRIMFPIADNYGHVVAFSGRKYKEEQNGGKYINYPETLLFKKSEILYHYYIAKEEAKKVGYIYVVEGFMDVIAYVRAGIKSVCALMGTALTEQHIQALKRLNVEVRIALDSDEAGRLGIERCLPLLNEAKINVRVQWAFKKAKDADELLTKYGQEEFFKEINRLFDPVIFLLGRKVDKNGRMDDSNQVLDFLNLVCPYFYSLDPLSQNKDLKIISEKTGFDKDAILKVLNKSEKSFIQEEKRIVDKKKDENKQFVQQLQTKYPFYQRKPKANYFDLSKLKLGKKYNQAEAILKIQKQIINYCKNQNIVLTLNDCLESQMSKKTNFMQMLCQNEAELILVIGQKREAYKVCEANNVSFIINPLYELCSLYGSYYMNNINLLDMTKKDYDYLLDFINSENTTLKNDEEKEDIISDSDMFDFLDTSDLGSTKKEEDNDTNLEELDNFFDLDDIENDSKSDFKVQKDIPSVDKELIIEIISTIYNIDVPLYDDKKFDRNIKLHKKLSDLYIFLKQIVENKAGILNIEDKIKCLNLIIEIQKT